MGISTVSGTCSARFSGIVPVMLRVAFVVDAAAAESAEIASGM